MVHWQKEPDTFLFLKTCNFKQIIFRIESTQDSVSISNAYNTKDPPYKLELHEFLTITDKCVFNLITNKLKNWISHFYASRGRLPGEDFEENFQNNFAGDDNSLIYNFLQNDENNENRINSKLDEKIKFHFSPNTKIKNKSDWHENIKKKRIPDISFAGYSTTKSNNTLLYEEDQAAFCVPLPPILPLGTLAITIKDVQPEYLDMPEYCQRIAILPRPEMLLRYKQLLNIFDVDPDGVLTIALTKNCSIIQIGHYGADCLIPNNDPIIVATAQHIHQQNNLIETRGYAAEIIANYNFLQLYKNYYSHHRQKQIVMQHRCIMAVEDELRYCWNERFKKQQIEKYQRKKKLYNQEIEEPIYISLLYFIKLKISDRIDTIIRNTQNTRHKDILLKARLKLPTYKPSVENNKINKKNQSPKHIIKNEQSLKNIEMPKKITNINLLLQQNFAYLEKLRCANPHDLSKLKDIVFDKNLSVPEFSLLYLNIMKFLRTKILDKSEIHLNSISHKWYSFLIEILPQLIRNSLFGERNKHFSKVNALSFSSACLLSKQEIFPTIPLWYSILHELDLSSIVEKSSNSQEINSLIKNNDINLNNEVSNNIKHFASTPNNNNSFNLVNNKNESITKIIKDSHSTPNLFQKSKKTIKTLSNLSEERFNQKALYKDSQNSFIFSDSVNDSSDVDNNKLPIKNNDHEPHKAELKTLLKYKSSVYFKPNIDLNNNISNMNSPTINGNENNDSSNLYSYIESTQPTTSNIQTKNSDIWRNTRINSKYFRQKNQESLVQNYNRHNLTLDTILNRVIAYESPLEMLCCFYKDQRIQKKLYAERNAEFEKPVIQKVKFCGSQTFYEKFTKPKANGTAQISSIARSHDKSSYVEKAEEIKLARLKARRDQALIRDNARLSAFNRVVLGRAPVAPAKDNN